LELIKTVLIAILVFGFLIFIHEFGHYIFARIFKVTITEFSIGMGPKIVWYDSKKNGIRYAISAIPIGGYVAMVGEDSESDDPNAFNKKPCWQRLIVIVAGAAVNIIAGIIATVIFVSLIDIGGTTVAQFPETKDYEFDVRSSESGLMIDDTILRVEGRRVRIPDQLSYEIMRHGDEPVDLVVLRDGREITLEDVVFPTAEEQGQTFGVMDFKVYREEKGFFKVIGYSFTKAFLIVRMCWESIFDLITGRYSFAAVSGPVGISEAIGTAANAGALSLLNITALISMNLGVMNLLPLPALDGGRTLMILIEMITRKKIPAKIEQTINAVGLMVLLGLSAIIMVKDIFGLFT
jgi:regulator of sigma E protease